MKKALLLSLLCWSGQVSAFPGYSTGDNIRGAQLMTPEERREYTAKLPNMKSMDECRAYMNAHYLELDKRAKERGVILPPISGDPCELMKTMGRFN